MARLQILQLPEGAGDDRPPFILVIDQVTPEMVEGITSAERTTAELIGARAIFSFEETVHIPANDLTPYSEATERTEPLCLSERAIQAEEKLKAFMDKRYEVEEKRKASLTDALGMDRLRDWDDILNAVTGCRMDREALADAVERVRGLPEHPDIMDAKLSEPNGYLHGYRVAIFDAKRAVQQRAAESTSPEPSPKDG
ncbi:hypothetical protein [Streptomyces sp. NRRL S-1022]|uniref:hypothetical protein n=1 Tax=Streptomyces sp. NRRL S-1022 TaxID=1463880 RepID=UPI0004BF8AC9|nr:hypothetical protein [Streptomyces sp. NRRL S-1022]